MAKTTDTLTLDNFYNRLVELGVNADTPIQFVNTDFDPAHIATIEHDYTTGAVRIALEKTT
jgi:hypothetical protein